MSDSARAAAAMPARPFLRRFALLILLTTGLVTLGAFGYAASQHPLYTSESRVLVEPLVLPGEVVHGPDMGTELAIARSAVVEHAVASVLHVDPAIVSHAAKISVPVDANVLSIRYTAEDKEMARRGADAIASGYIEYRNSKQVKPVRKDAETPSAPGLQARVISPASVSSSPSSPDYTITLVAGVFVGGLLGGLVAIVTDRLGVRIRTAARWQEVTGIPVLVGLGRSRSRPLSERPASGLESGKDPVDERFRYLRARVTQLVPRTGGLVVVTSVVDQYEKAITAGRLAAAFEDAGGSTVLVRLEKSPIATVSRTKTALGVTRSRERLMVHIEAPGVGPRDDGVASDDDAGPVGIAELNDLVVRLRKSADLVIVEAPAVFETVDALDIAVLADTVVLVDHLALARRDRTNRAIAELENVGCHIGGAVLAGVSRWALRTVNLDERGTTSGDPRSAEPAWPPDADPELMMQPLNP